jgi:hypothetical protein
VECNIYDSLKVGCPLILKWQWWERAHMKIWHWYRIEGASLLILSSLDLSSERWCPYLRSRIRLTFAYKWLEW